MNIRQALNRAKKLGFKASDKLSYFVSDYRLVLNQDTFEEREVWSTKKEYFYNLTFPSDYTGRTIAVYDAGGILAAIRQYENRFEDAKRDAEFSRQTIEAVAKLGAMLEAASGAVDEHRFSKDNNGADGDSPQPRHQKGIK